MPHQSTCKAEGCSQSHIKHYCKICKNNDSTHRASKCPYVKREKYDKLMNEIKYNNIINALFCITMSIMFGLIETTLIYMIFYGTLFSAMYYTISFKWMKRELDRIPPFQKGILIAMIAAIIWCIVNIQQLKDRVLVLEQGYKYIVHGALEQINSRLDGLMTENEIFRRVDDMITARIKRERLGWGCFIEGTQIQINKDGTLINVEQLNNNDYVYSPILDKQVKIRNITEGLETGYMYEFITMDSMSVIVTATHPMKMCGTTVLCDAHCDYNVAAENVQAGDWTLTENGYQQICSIRKILVDGVMVYNFVVDDEEALHTVMANGIHTFDLMKQKQHHSNV